MLYLVQYLCACFLKILFILSRTMNSHELEKKMMFSFSRLLEMLHMDLMGPIVQCLGRKKYILRFKVLCFQMMNKNEF
ncbi:unnamed protein product, partial [Vitis vinifera]|uniref:Uncharacterized protein n=1 Tax=Vitis vinifera TaxID=29760 RepID=D7SN16_VITVI